MKYLLKSKKLGNMFMEVDDNFIKKHGDITWYPHKRDNKIYVYGTTTIKGRRKTFRLQRVIMAAPKHSIVDHINGDTLDNRRSNLRICNQSSNLANASKRLGEFSSKYKGVSKMSNGRFRATISKNNKFFHIGCFANEVNAAFAYNIAAETLFGEFARLNELEGYE